MAHDFTRLEKLLEGFAQNSVPGTLLGLVRPFDRTKTPIPDDNAVFA